ncbi:unnamed protein product [Anisakis simplex]|uniref:Huntingtin interacting protein-related (inferred by orthology to a S. mansoni protein) n=1 Tax=Anisakis simplex TaxID=6269 RepID=A0A0M3J141_ANISI|nr:unnamed protein product [Anisakis simplex]
MLRPSNAILAGLSNNTSNVSSSSTTASEIWSEHTASDGRVYYYNKVTKQSSWTKPEELRTPEEVSVSVAIVSQRKAAVARIWREYKTAEGRPYYYNTETKETTWTCPKDFEPRSTASSTVASSTTPIKTEKPQSVDTKETPSSSTDVAKKANSVEGESELEKAMMATLKSLDQQPTVEKEDESRAENAENERGESGVTGDEEKDLKKKQSDRFRELLRDKKFDA